MISTQESRVALRPNCNEPHHYEQVRFGFVNDSGAWQIACLACRKPFLLRVINPVESTAEFHKTVFDEADETPAVAWARAVVAHNIPRTDYAPAFDLDGAPLFRSASGENLEPHAIAALVAEISGVRRAYHSAENYLASKSAFGGRFAVVHVQFTDCPCGQSHIATLYTEFKVTFQPVTPAAFLLADVTGTDLEDHLEGVLSKSDIMDLLSKLLVRWHLTSERVVVASPFVGHLWDTEEAKKIDRWHWLLKQLDPDRATLITRPASFTAFKKLAPGSIAYDELKTLGLENKLISTNVKKHDFHAKFFIGMGRDDCEVLSGSANLVRGSSVENISFRRMSRSRCDERYIKPMSLALPEVKDQPSQFVRLFKDEAGSWIARDEVGTPLAGRRVA